MAHKGIYSVLTRLRPIQPKSWVDFWFMVFDFGRGRGQKEIAKVCKWSTKVFNLMHMEWLEAMKANEALSASFWQAEAKLKEVEEHLQTCDF